MCDCLYDISPITLTQQHMSLNKERAMNLSACETIIDYTFNIV